MEGLSSTVFEQAALKSHKSKLASLDACAYIDSFWLDAIMGEEGLKHLNATFREKCLPSTEKRLEVKAALAEAKKLQASDLFKVLMHEYQNRLSTCVDWLDCLVKNTPPSSFKESNAFLTEVWSRLPFFFQCVQKTDAAGSASKPVSTAGVPAIIQAWDGLKDQSVDDITVSELDAVYVFKPWLSSDVQKAITKKRQTVVASALRTKPVAKKAEPAKGSKTKQSSDEKALNAARAMLAKKK
eukprot:2450856-Amphidinium_carterae.2